MHANVGYRFEVRVKPHSLYCAVNILKNAILTNKFNKINKTQILENFNEILKEFLSFIKGESVLDIFNLFIIEMIFNRVYLMEVKNTHIIPTEITHIYNNFALNVSCKNNLKDIFHTFPNTSKKK